MGAWAWRHGGMASLEMGFETRNQNLKPESVLLSSKSNFFYICESINNNSCLMDYEILKLTVDENIAIVTISRPQALNALNTRFFLEMDAMIKQVSGMPESG